MKFRPDDTMSERQLAMALAKTGRNVPLSRLTAWRKDGLLPPLSSTGLGAGAGRAYYWVEPDILAQAVMAHDGMARHGRADVVSVSLWLRGFTVPLPKLRRAWQSCLKSRRTRAIRRSAGTGDMTAAGDLSQLLLQSMLGAADAVQPDGTDRPALLILAAAVRRLDIPAGDSMGRVRQFWQMARLLTSALATTDLLAQASDEEMLKAHEALRIALQFLADSAGEEMDIVAHLLGETLFCHIITLLRSGQDTVLDAAFARIATAQSRPRAHQPQPLYAQA